MTPLDAAPASAAPFLVTPAHKARQRLPEQQPPDAGVDIAVHVPGTGTDAGPRLPIP